MYVTEELDEIGGVAHFNKVWVCCGHVWTKSIKWDDLEALGWCPVCPDCGGYDGSLFI